MTGYMVAIKKTLLYMKYIFTFLVLTIIGTSPVLGQPADFVWQTQSRNSSESMPCGGGDIGMNVWVENDEILFYLSRSGSFDENNTLLKQGRFRVRLTPNPFAGTTDFRQKLCLKDGYVSISANGSKVLIWADVFHPVVHVEVETGQLCTLNLSYENWRYKDRVIRKGEGQQCSYKWAIPKGLVTSRDSIRADEESLTFFHKNPEKTVFDVAVKQQGLEKEKSQLYNPIKNLIFGGRVSGKNLTFSEIRQGTYVDTDYKAWEYKSKKPAKRQTFQIVLHAEQNSLVEWEKNLAKVSERVNISKDKQVSRRWWNAFWQRSFIESTAEAAEVTRNYALFRYMLGCNAHSQWPTKFNGGLFTFDPVYADPKSPFTPDFRKWGGGTATAQNQRLVYWPMLASGDFDMMLPQFDFYLRLLPAAELRSRVYWGHKGACFTEQMENFGLPNPAEYGFKRPESFDKGIEYNAWLEYEWDTVLEFCQMILETARYNEADICRYLPLIESSLTFFDEHYRYLARRRGRKELDGNGKLVLYPGSACETYKMTYNASSTIAALRTVLETYGRKPDMMACIPEVPLRVIEGKEMIAPAIVWERVNNIETPQLYPVFPWRIYGVGKENVEIARNTYLHDKDAQKIRSHIGWKQDNIWAACLGMTDEAARLTLQKMANGPHRFPAFWGPGYDWTPDHNWGGSGMIGMQEMLLQEVGGKILLFPAWPQKWDVHFKLHARGRTTVEATLKDGKLIYLKVIPKEREKDIRDCLISI